MRISTAGMHDAALAAMMKRSAELARTQEQIASGKRVRTPADDPSAAVHILQLERTLAESEQLARNATAAQNRLSFEEQSLADMTNLLQRVRDLTVQANGGTLDPDSLEAIAVEVRTRAEELMSIANRQDATGEYLFSGYSTLTQPFARNGASVEYSGDHGVRFLQTGPDQRVADGHSGAEVFMNVVEGNGTFVPSANPANTGSASIGAATVTDRTAWHPDTYTIQFTSATEWRVVDSTNVVVTSGTFSPPTGAVAFNGVQVSLSGEPAAGDEFTVAPSTTEDMFTTLDNLVAALESPIGTNAERAQFATALGKALTQIDRALTHVGDVRAEVGARLSAIEQSESSRLDRELELKSSLSEVRDLDYAEAITRLNLQLVGLQAAQQSYTRIGQLSLFDYL